MLKKLYVISAFVVVVFSMIVAFKTLQSVQTRVPQQDEQVLGEKSEISGQMETEKYKLSWFYAEPENLSLIPNFSENKTSGKIVEENSCKFAANGSFYQGEIGEYKPIGLFVANSEIINPYRTNNLFNGILSINQFDTPRITTSLPKDPLITAIQTGPVILENDNFMSYSKSNDKNARRMIAMVTGENKLIFMTIYDKSSSFNGPKLSELKDIVKEFEESQKINVADAINLDGGSASAFYSENLSLKEISPVGSLFCLK